tara:strand:+ start:182 stop:481 length:300 start_codon:yes stop_codon:yes gene_type:complete
MSEFKKKAQSTLDKIFNIVESEYPNVEVDYEDENLKIECVDNNYIFIVSMHTPTSQIWLSSPISGAHHFMYVESKDYEWVSTRDENIKLLDLIKKELLE